MYSGSDYDSGNATKLHVSTKHSENVPYRLPSSKGQNSVKRGNDQMTLKVDLHPCTRKPRTNFSEIISLRMAKTGKPVVGQTDGRGGHL